MDIELHYTERGSGEPLILLHGNGRSSAFFKNQIAALAARFRVLAVDTRGHGASPRGSAPFTLEQFAQDLRDFLDARGIGQTNLLGCSDGGNIALLFALRQPERVRKLVLDGANLRPSGMALPLRLAVGAGYALASAAAPVSSLARAEKERLSLMAREPRISEAELSRLSAPTLVLAGTRDVIRASHTRRIAAAIPGARLRFLPGGHGVAAENAGAFNAAVLEFLAP